MKRITLISIISFFSITLFGQTFVNIYGSHLFESGTKLLEIGDLQGADSLLSLALCSFKNENVYYNRGVSRLLQKDTLGFCKDIEIAVTRYFDKEAASLFNDICCTTVDTIFYDRKFNPVKESKYRYYEEIRQPKFSNTFGIIHDIKSEIIRLNIDYGCEQSLIGLNTKTTDIIAIYEIRDSVKYFRDCPKPVNIYNSEKYKNIISKAKKLLQIKYGELKTEYNIEELTIVFEITINSLGDIINVSYTGLFPEIPIGEIEKELEQDLIQIVKHYPKVTPASFNKEKVNFIIFDSIKY